ncbi:MAG: hypothetical protein ACOYD0_04065 [Candidatus Nanopelagicales bacterium]
MHGDAPGAVVMARRIRAAFDAALVRVTPFAHPPTRQVGRGRDRPPQHC